MGKAQLHSHRPAASGMGERVRSRRLLFGMTQQELAERVGTGQASISYLERGKHRSLKIVEVAFDLDCSPTWLVMGFGANAPAIGASRSAVTPARRIQESAAAAAKRIWSWRDVEKTPRRQAALAKA